MYARVGNVGAVTRGIRARTMHHRVHPLARCGRSATMPRLARSPDALDEFGPRENASSVLTVVTSYLPRVRHLNLGPC